MTETGMVTGTEGGESGSGLGLFCRFVGSRLLPLRQRCMATTLSANSHLPWGALISLMLLFFFFSICSSYIETILS